MPDPRPWRRPSADEPEPEPGVPASDLDPMAIVLGAGPAPPTTPPSTVGPTPDVGPTPPDGSDARPRPPRDPSGAARPGGRVRRAARSRPSRCAAGNEVCRRCGPTSNVAVTALGHPAADASASWCPAYGEGERIGQTVAELRRALDVIDAYGGVEIVVVDDGSDDDTAVAAERAGADVVVRHEVNRGKGAAVRSGVLAADGRCVVFTDADLAYAPDQIPGLVALVEDGWDVVVGSRRHTDTTTLVRARRLREVGGRAINILTRAVLLGRYRDTQCGLKAFRSDAARLIFSRTRVDGFAFDVELFHLVERYHLSLAEVPVTIVNSDRSSVRALRDALRPRPGPLPCPPVGRRGPLRPHRRRPARCQPADLAVEGPSTSVGAMADADAASLDAIFKAYDIRGVVPDQLDAALVRRIGAAFARFAADTLRRRPRARGPRHAALGPRVRRGVRRRSHGPGPRRRPPRAGLDRSAVLRGGGVRRPRRHADGVAQPGAVQRDQALPRRRRAGRGGHRAGSRSRPTRSSGLPPVGDAGSASSRDDALAAFAEHVHSFVDIDALAPLRVVADTANGMGGLIAPAVFAGLPVTLDLLYGELDGTFPNHPADPIQPENLVDLQARVARDRRRHRPGLRRRRRSGLPGRRPGPAGLGLAHHGDRRRRRCSTRTRAPPCCTT